MNKTILLTGGLGYIGSVVAALLHAGGDSVVIIDKMVYKQTIWPSWARVIKADIANAGVLNSLCKEFHFDAVMHFAGLIEVGISVKQPDLFYQNNVIGSLGLLDAMHRHGIKKIIFSSTCAVYGNPIYMPMDEVHPLGPVSPYGKTKLAVEYMIQDYAAAFGLNYAIFRYFNAAGALPDLQLGEQHDPETHVIPLLLRAALQRKPFTIFGDTYPTPDGTCIRDYIHVYDIAYAHIQALKHLFNDGSSDVFNLGTGDGYSVHQLVEVVSKVSGLSVQTVVAERRRGDAPVLVANAEHAKKILGWRPVKSSLEAIIQDAWDWERSRSAAFERVTDARRLRV